jgi:hypothetical protein
MSIDISSIIPVIHPIDIKVSKEEDSQMVREVEESSGSGGSALDLDRERNSEIVRDNLIGVGDTYSVRGELIKEYGSRSTRSTGNIPIDVRI